MKCISIFKCNPQIEYIDKSHCSLEDVPNFQNYSRSLEELFLDANKLTALNDNVFRLTRLRRFSCSDNAILDIPPDIAKLVNLVELDCSRNKIGQIPDQIKFLRGLQICDFSANNIEYLSSGLVQLKNLTCLTLNYCPIKFLPEDFGQLKNLESLEMRENELESLPASFTNLESLKKLDIGRNLICELPEDIGRLTNLEYLLVDGNRLSLVPSDIGRLKNLQCLDLSQQECGLKAIPEEIGGLTSLTDLHLSENHLQSLPDGIRSLRSLMIFKADNNYLDELNPNIGGCTALQELVLTSNQIVYLPSTISNLTDLRSANFDSNLLREIPPEFGNLRQLGILSLRDNLLTRLPTEIGQLEMLRVMDVSGNRLEYLPASMTALGLKALWLSKNQAQPLPKLQTDELPNSGKKILTCYLLPQQGDPDSSFDQAAAAMFTGSSDHVVDNRPAAVSFDTAAVDDSELATDANFVRHDTPHPRELKARHQKLLNTIQSQNKTELKGHDNASFNMTDPPLSKQERGYEQHDRTNIPQYQQTIEYESNGLPEVASNPTTGGMRNENISQYVEDYNNYQRKTTTKTTTTTNYSDNLDGRYGNGLDNGSYQKKDYAKATFGSQPAFVGSDQKLPGRSFIMDIVVRRMKNHKPGLGLSIAGGKDTPPFKDDDDGIFVSKVTRGGPAEAAGVKVGDKILAVNNNIFHDGITHQRAVGIFKTVKPNCEEFTMNILRDPDYEPEDESQIEDYIPPPASVGATNKGGSSSEQRTSNTSTFTRTYTIPVKTDSNGTSSANIRSTMSGTTAKENAKKANASTLPPGMSLFESSPSRSNIIYTTLVKNYKNDLGLVLENRADDNDSRAGWSNVAIAEIKPNSIADLDGKLQVDDRLLTINGTDVTGIDLDRIMTILHGSERFIRLVVSRGDSDDPIGAALRNVPVRPPLGSWFSSTSNMSHRPSLIESYQRPTFGSVSSLRNKQDTPSNLSSTTSPKPPKPPKPSHLSAKSPEPSSPEMIDDSNPVAMPRVKGAGVSGSSGLELASQISDAEKRAAWRRERLKSIEDDVEMAKAIAEAQRKRREEK